MKALCAILLFVSIIALQEGAWAASVSITINRNGAPMTNSYKPGVSLVDNDISPWGNSKGVSAAINLIRNGGAIGYINSFIQGWGMGDLWVKPPPTQNDVNPAEFELLDYRMNLTVGTSITPIISLCEAPWWMKGELQADGSTKLLTEAEEWSDIAYSSRVLDNKMSNWLLLVQRVAERYMGPPWNVRTFQVWNELKGYYNPKTNAWDYNNSPGDPSGNHAKHGYTFMYNQVYNRLIQVAQNKGIAVSTIQIGGPYVVIDSWATKSQSNPSNVTGPWGVIDQRSLDVVKFWLENKVGGQFIAVDGGNENKDKEITTDFQRTLKFRDVGKWIRQQPGGASLPIVWSEYYVDVAGTYDENRNNALKTYSLTQILPTNAKTALWWGGNADSGTTGGLWIPTSSANGGQATKFFTSQKYFNQYFSAGTDLYPLTISDNTLVGAIASKSMLLLVNTQNADVAVNVDGGKYTVTLTPYQVLVHQITW